MPGTPKGSPSGSSKKASGGSPAAAAPSPSSTKKATTTATTPPADATASTSEPPAPPSLLNTMTAGSAFSPSKTTRKKPAIASVDRTPVEAMEKDVLLGRGNRIHKWPGNVHFRHIIHKHRADYLDRPDPDKVLVGRRVLEDIAAVGGRFLTQDGMTGDEWRVVEEARALEKSCQALREKRATHVANPDQDTSAVKQQEESLSSATFQPKAKRSALESSDSVEEKDGGENEPAAKKSRRNPPSPNRSKGGKAAAVRNNSSATTTTPMERIRSLLEDEMVTRLKEFVKEHGHCAVPPLYGYNDTNHPFSLGSNNNNNNNAMDSNDIMEEDTNDPEGGQRRQDHEKAALADWCIAQRQVYREVVTTEYRRATENEQACLKRLKELDFVWDYSEWHYQRMWNKLQKEMADNDKAVREGAKEEEKEGDNKKNSEKQETEPNDTSKAPEGEVDNDTNPTINNMRRRPKSKPISKECRAWWLNQREQYRSENASHWTPGRLEQLGPLYL